MSVNAVQRLMHRTVANLTFLGLFPGFFFANALMAAGLIPAFGVFSVVSSIALGYFFTVGLGDLMRNADKVPVLSLLIIALFTTCLLWTFWPYLLSYGISSDVTKQNLVLIGSWAALLSIGVFLDVNSIRIYLNVSIFGMILVVLVLMDWQNLILNLQARFNSDEVSTYQEISRSGMITSLALLSLVRGNVLNRMVAASCLVALVFALGARSEFFGMVLAILAYEGVRGVRDVRVWGVNIALATPIVLVLMLYADKLASSRQAAVFNVINDASWQLRMKMESVALHQIWKEPFSGVPGGHFDAGGAGAYSHNILSSWVSFGLPGFSFYLVLMLLASFVSLKACLRKNPDWRWRMAFYLNVSSLILVFAAKPVFWPVPALGWGLIINAVAADRRGRALPREGARNSSEASPTRG